jgi:ATP-dependent protease Clp ATPase subunit
MGMLHSVLRALVGRPDPLRCSHCARTKEEAHRFVSGPGLYLCDACAADATARFAATPPEAVVRACSFCGLTSRAIELGAERRHAICRDCIELVEDILAEDMQRRPVTGEPL